MIAGNNIARDFFARAVAANRLSHAYLFVGPHLDDSRRFARELAKVFYCAEARACGTCAACVQVEHSNHPNVNFYGPTEGKTFLEIDHIRALCERTHYRSSGIQIAVLEGAEMMTEPAANALLKTLEEPPGSALIILLAQSTGAILSTIVSRCHRIFLRGEHVESEPLPEMVREALDDVLEPSFYARSDIRGWISHVFPDEESSRSALRRLLHGLIEQWRTHLAGLDGITLDDALRRLSVGLELRQDVDRNVSPELVLERLFRMLRRGG